MKLLSAVLLTVVAVVSADTGYEQGYGYNSQPSNNYYYQPRPKPGGLTGLLQRFFGGSSSRPFADRQQTGFGTGAAAGAPAAGAPAAGAFAAGPLAAGATGGIGIGSILPFIFPIFLLLGGLFALALVLSLLPSLTSSGRGLDVDEWEIDHSVWMDQLKADFENSWSTE